MNYKLYFKYILLNTRAIFIKNLLRHDKNTNVLITPYLFYFLNLHFKLSSLFYSLQLIDIFAYELPINITSLHSVENKIKPSTKNHLLVYNFHSILFQQRFYLFILIDPSLKLQPLQELNISITELFQNANWLEREAAELNGIQFIGKKDLRNLMLQYGDLSAPFQKSYPSIGTREIFYDVISDTLIQAPVTIQF